MSLGLRAIMFDAARLQERDEHYRKVIRFAADWGANAIVFRLADDQGTAMRFKALPPARRKGQYSHKGMRDLVKYARGHGIKLIPEVETLGHSRYITSHPGFEDLSEGAEKGYGGLCTSNPRTYEVLEAVITEVSEVFDSDLIHLGCDESVFGACPRCRRKLAKESKHVLYARHIGRLHRIAASLGKRIIIWSDHLTNLWGDGRIYDKKAVKLVPRDVIIANWDYRHTVTDVSTDELTRAGFQVLTCPALHWCRAAVYPSKLEITNVKRFVKQAHRYSDRGAVGSIITIWCPYRFIADAMWHSIALACRMMSEPRPDRKRFDAEFFKSFHGVSYSRTLGRAYEHFYNSALGLQKEFYALFFATPEQMKDAAKIASSRVEYLWKNAAEAKRLFEKTLPSIKKHRTKFRACILGADIVLEGCRRWNAAREMVRKKDPASLRKLARKADSLCRRAARYWDRARFADDPQKLAPHKLEARKAYLVAQLKAAADFSSTRTK